MPRPRSLTQADIAVAALAVIDRGGLPALSVRAVAAELGMGTMSLYRYFRDREELEGFVVDHVFDSLHPTNPARSPWEDRVAGLLQRFRDAAAAHPAVVPLLLTRRFTSESAMPWAEALLAALKDAGFGSEQRFHALRLLTSFVIGAVQSEHLGPLPRNGTLIAAERHAAEYPLLAENAPHARRISADDEYRRGLAVILHGLRSGLSRSVTDHDDAGTTD